MDNMETSVTLSLRQSKKICWTIFLIVYCLAFVLSLTNAQNATTAAPMTVRHLTPVNVRITWNSEVEVTFDEPGTRWYRVLVPYFADWEVAGVVCRELGLGHPERAEVSIAPGDQESVVVLCNGRELSLEDCDFNVSTISPRPLKMRCLPARAEEFDVVLLKEYTFIEGGSVLIYADGRWGPICSGPGMGKACDVICRQLGYVRCDGELYTPAGRATSDPLLGNVYCSEGVTSLKECSYSRLSMGQSCNDNPTVSYLKVGCSYYRYHDYNYHGYDSNFIHVDDEDSGSTDGRVISSSVLGFIIVVVIAIIYMMYHCCKGQGPATSSSHHQPAEVNHQVPSTNTDHLLPSHQAVRNSSPSAGEPSGFPTRTETVYPPYHQEAPSYHQLYPASATELAYPPAGVPIPAYGDAEPAIEDPELPTYEEAIKINSDE